MDEFIDKDGYVYCEIRKDMYGLKESGCVGFQNLVNNLAPFGYEPMLCTPGLWRHNTCHTTFILAAYDFGIKHFNQDDIDHLLNTLKTHYTISEDPTGSHYCVLQIYWNYDKQYLDISMPGYVVKALHEFQHPYPKKPQYAPHAWIPPTYGQKVKYAFPPEMLPVLYKKGTKRVQSITGTFQYYMKDIDPTMILAVKKLASQQLAPMQ